LELNPNSDGGHVRLATVYNHVGLLEEALAHAEQAAVINPRSDGARMQRFLALMHLRKHEQALQIPSPGPLQLPFILYQMGQRDQARAALDKIPPGLDQGGIRAGFEAMMYAAAGDESRAAEKIRIAGQNQTFGHFHHTAAEIADAYALMHKPDQAIQWLELTADTGNPCYPAFANDPHLDSLRQDPRFTAFLARMKQQWEHYKTLR
jgi:tetratricopeptide (TPR) repeat protein